MAKSAYKLHIDLSSLIHYGASLTGIQRVEYQICHYFVKRPGSRFFYYSLSRQRFVFVDKGFVVALVGGLGQGGKIYRQISQTKKALEKAALRPLVCQPADLVLIPYGVLDNENYVSSLQKLSRKAKVIQLIHDTIPIKLPQFVSREATEHFQSYKKILPHASSIIAISDNTKQDIKRQLKAWRIADKPISRMTWGSDFEVSGGSSKPPGVKAEDYALYVSTVEARKNHNLLAQAYRLADEQGIGLPHLYLVGQAGVLADDFFHTIRHDPVLKEKISHLGVVSDRELAWLYRQARYTVYPSHYEGWGLPVSESLAYGCVTLSSRAASLPEVGGRFADYFSPYSAQELLDLMARYQDGEVLAKRRDYIRQKYRYLTWQESMAKLEASLAGL